MAILIVTAPFTQQTFTHRASDGTLRAWNATRGMEIAAEGHELLTFSLTDFAVSPDAVRQRYPELDEKHALTTDLTRPLLFIPFGEEVLLIDGYHRLWKAATLGVPELPMYLLTQAEADAIQVCELPPDSEVKARSHPEPVKEDGDALCR